MSSKRRIVRTVAGDLVTVFRDDSGFLRVLDAAGRPVLVVS